MFFEEIVHWYVPLGTEFEAFFTIPILVVA